MNTDEKCLMITMIAFLALMLYYYVYRPSYVMDMEKNEKKKNENISIRKCLVYSMLWSSALGLLFLFVMMFYKNSENKNNNNNNNNNNKENKFSVEPPTFRS